jgi:septum formation topological specificity factor MinE
MISTIRALEDDSLVLSYFFDATETMVTDITDEILEVVNKIVPIQDEDSEDEIPIEPSSTQSPEP